VKLTSEASQVITVASTEEFEDSSSANAHESIVSEEPTSSYTQAALHVSSEESGAGGPGGSPIVAAVV
jgi:hypothetical protein